MPPSARAYWLLPSLRSPTRLWSLSAGFRASRCASPPHDTTACCLLQWVCWGGVLSVFFQPGSERDDLIAQLSATEEALEVAEAEAEYCENVLQSATAVPQ